MKRFWIKLELRYLHDPIMGQLPNYLWRRVIELFMLAGENGDDGLLQPVKDLAWQLHTSISDMEKSLRNLAELGIVQDSPQGWVVSGFKESQASSTSTQRVQEYRRRIKSASKMKHNGNPVGSRKLGQDEMEDETDDDTEDDIENDSREIHEEERELGLNYGIVEDLEDVIKNETELETDEETEEETEEDQTLSSSTSHSNSFSGSKFSGDEVQEKGGRNAFAIFEANISQITPMLADSLRADIDDYGETWVCDAIREAVRSNARNIKYVEAILKRWQKDGRGTSKPSPQSRKRSRTAEDQDQEAEDRHRYVKGKYKDWIIH